MGEKADFKIKKFVEKVKKKFRIDKVVLFGSRARGDYLEDSDYDIIFVSSDFKDKLFSERVSNLYDYWDYFPLNIEPLCYTPEEFKKMRKRIGIVQQAIKEGVEI